MTTAAAGGCSRVFTVSFCKTCHDRRDSMPGGSPYEISIGSTISGVPQVK